MSTRSLITAKYGDKYMYVYCHSDSYPEHHVPILEQYSTPKEVEALLTLGDMSILDSSIECPEEHSFNHQVPGYCVFYGRDRGDENTSVMVANGFEILNEIAVNIWAEYIYVYDMDVHEWTWFQVKRPVNLIGVAI
jgi:hypothetical protein